MDNNNNIRKIYTEQEIWELDLDELEEMSGGAVQTNSVRCPRCGQYHSIRTIKEHLAMHNIK